MVIILIVLLLMTNATCNPNSLSEEEYKSITSSELKTHVEYLASDQLEGRGTGSAGYLKAAEYAALQFKKYGLKPLTGIDNPDNPYFQNIPLWKIQGQEGNELLIKVGKERHHLHASEESFILNPSTNLQPGVINGKPIFIGNGIYEPELDWDDFKGQDLEGRIVILRIGVPRNKNGDIILPEERNRFYESMDGPGPEILLENVASRGASALVVIPNEFLLQNWTMVKMNYTNSILDKDGYDNLQSEPELPVLILNREESTFLMSRLTDNPLQTQAIDFRGELDEVEITLTNKVEWTSINSPNVIGVVNGTAPELQDQYIIVGAHLDHLGVVNGQIYNGAVDNATGSAVILEVAESIAADPLPRPVVFILYAAEEVGHYGSLHFVNIGPIPIEQIMVNVNVDHAGRDNPMFDDILVAGLKRIDPRLDGIVRSANKRAGVKLHFDETMAERYYSGSDHYSFDQAGIPSIVYGTGSFDGYHTTEDDAEYVEYKYTFDIAKITLESIRELGKITTVLRHRH